MASGKILVADATPTTKLSEIYGFGKQTFATLNNAGVNVLPTDTVQDFKSKTKSYNTLRDVLKKSNLHAKYILPRFQKIWNISSESSSAQPEDVEVTVNPSAMKKQAEENRVVEQENNPVEVRSDDQQNPLLVPKPLPGPNTSNDAELVGNKNETPELDAMTRTNVSDPAVGKGLVAARQEPYVIPDQTETISPTDKNVNAPMEVLPDDPIPVVPGVAVGPVVREVREVEAKTLEEKQEDDRMQDDLEAHKANGQKDIGGDGFGALTYESKVETPSMSKFGTTEFSSGDVKPSNEATPTTTSTTKPMDISSYVEQNPFKQSSMYRNYDSNIYKSNLIKHASSDLRSIRSAEMSVGSYRDITWQRYNPLTEGVRSVEIPTQANNYLSRAPLVSDYQLMGAYPLRPTYSPSPYESEKILGKF